MIRKKEELTVDFSVIRGGNGETEKRHILRGEEELYGKGRMFAHMILQPGRSIGEHVHENDNEIFYFLTGTGTYNDNGTVTEIGAGDTAICNKGEMHGVVNTGSVPLEFIALILY